MKNCFTYYPWSKRYYLTHPWNFFTDTWHNLRAGWQRITRGWANRDVWSLDNYLLEILPEMIDQLSKTTHGYPGEQNGFPTYESWTEYLQKEIVEPLRNARENQTVQVNEYEEELHSYPKRFIKNEDGSTTLKFTEPKELRDKWCAREIEIRKWRQAELERGLSAMAKHFYSCGIKERISYVLGLCSYSNLCS